MSPANALLVQAGEALYGPRWQTDMANALGVSDRTMRRWVANEPVGWNVIADVERLLGGRKGSIDQILATIKERKAAELSSVAD